MLTATHITNNPQLEGTHQLSHQSQPSHQNNNQSAVELHPLRNTEAKNSCLQCQLTPTCPANSSLKNPLKTFNRSLILCPRMSCMTSFNTVHVRPIHGLKFAYLYFLKYGSYFGHVSSQTLPPESYS